MFKSVLLIALLLTVHTSAATAALTTALADQVVGVFAETCAQCHGVNLPRPKGKFGYVLDLGRIAQNPEMVVPFQPEKSKLWQMIADGDMPPDDAKAGAVTEAQAVVIHSWIETGAPVAQTVVIKQDAPPRLSLIAHALEWISRFHVVIVHFPIALLIVAASAEGAAIMLPKIDLAPIVRFCTRLGASAAITAATLGWTHAMFGAFRDDTSLILSLHRWIGLATCAFAAGAAILSFSPAWSHGKLFKALLFTTAALVGLAGHFGGLTVYGESYFRW